MPEIYLFEGERFVSVEDLPEEGLINEVVSDWVRLGKGKLLELNGVGIDKIAAEYKDEAFDLEDLYASQKTLYKIWDEKLLQNFKDKDKFIEFMAVELHQQTFVTSYNIHIKDLIDSPFFITGKAQQANLKINIYTEDDNKVLISVNSEITSYFRRDQASGEIIQEESGKILSNEFLFSIQLGNDERCHFNIEHVKLTSYTDKARAVFIAKYLADDEFLLKNYAINYVEFGPNASMLKLIKQRIPEIKAEDSLIKSLSLLFKRDEQLANKALALLGRTHPEYIDTMFNKMMENRENLTEAEIANSTMMLRRANRADLANQLSTSHASVETDVKPVPKGNR